MAENAIGSQQVVAKSGAARLSLAAAATFMVLLAVLHVLRPELDPSWRFVSEYADGSYGWVMMLSFFSLALSCAALFVAVQSQIGTISGKIGLGALLIVAVSLIAAGVFTADPKTASQDKLTTHGHLHALSAMVGIPGLPIAALLISLSLARRNQASSAVRRSLIWSALLSWVSVAAMFVYLAVALPHRGGNYCVWLMTVAWHVTQSRGQGA